MRRQPSDRFLRLSVRYTDGTWELASGGEIPVSEGVEAELILSRKSISDRSFIERMTARDTIKILNEGTTLFAYVAVHKEEELADELRSHLIPWKEIGHRIAPFAVDNWSSRKISLVPIKIGSLAGNAQSLVPAADGGLWLIVEGRESAGLKSSQIDLPDGVTDGPVISLNHAFTCLSEAYEPWRKSHTGNVYHRFLYEESDGLLYPLELLRDAALAKQEQAIAYKLWQDFLKRMAALGNA